MTENQHTTGNWWEDRQLNQRKIGENYCHHGTSPGDRCSSQYLWALDVKQWIQFERRQGGKKALTSFSLSYFSLCPSFLRQVSKEGERSIRPLLLYQSALPFTFHQIARVMGGFWPPRWPLRAEWLSVFMIQPQRSDTTVSISHRHTNRHPHSSSLIHPYKSKTDNSVPSVFILIPRLILIYFIHLSSYRVPLQMLSACKSIQHSVLIYKSTWPWHGEYTHADTHYYMDNIALQHHVFTNFQWQLFDCGRWWPHKRGL